ncbi:MAG: hypothetical protein O2995_15185 [Proteobacteria bacterium]|nr:hypothetical protein [Pseudomonadota bacterium]MDA1308331.1 hypothetical protein [Pseudomonadota bacterium]
MLIKNLFGEECHLDTELREIVGQLGVEPRSFDRAYLEDLQESARYCGFFDRKSRSDQISQSYRLLNGTHERFRERRAHVIDPFEAFLEKHRFGLYLERLPRDDQGNDLVPVWYVTDAKGVLWMRVRRLDRFVKDHPMFFSGPARRTRRGIPNLWEFRSPVSPIRDLRTFYANRD